MKIAFGTVKRGDSGSESTLSLVECSLKRGHEVYWFDYHDTYLEGGRPFTSCIKVRKVLDFLHHQPMARGRKVSMCLNDFDAVIVRKEPRLNRKIGRVFDKIDSHVLLMNDPCGILHYDGKCFLKNFPEFTAPSFYSSDVVKLKKWIRKHKNVVLKKNFSSGGRAVYHIFCRGKFFYLETGFGGPKRIRLDSLLKKVTKNGREEAVLVVYLKKVVEGDKRIIVLGNKIVGSFLRLPGKSHWICNIHSGGRFVRSSVTKDEMEMIKKITPSLVGKGLYFVGYDMLMGNKGKRVLSEINVANVGGLTRLNRLYKRDATSRVIEWVEHKVKISKSA
tara:strand:- start:6473 stop:7471 length:999 start_codon:yes stop_codon:yes gene_type:complete